MTMPRFLAKTYTRYSQKPNTAAQAFDDIFKTDNPKSAETDHVTKFTVPSVRQTNDGPVAKKQKTSDGLGDPFSFESDEDGTASPNKRSPRALGDENEAAPPALQPPQGSKPWQSLSVVSSSNNDGKFNGNSSVKMQVNSSVENSSESSEVKRCIKTYSRSNRPVTAGFSSSSNQRQVSLSKHAKETNQLSMDVFMKNARLKKDYSGTANNSDKAPVTYNRPRKFFTSRNRTGQGDKQNTQEVSYSRSKDHTYSQGTRLVIKKEKEAGSDDAEGSPSADHNYSFISNTKRLTADHTYSTSKQKLDPFLHRGDIAGEHAYGKSTGERRANRQGSSGEEDEGNYLYDSDNELTSGDPEIIFNSPTKRAKEMARISEDDRDSSSQPSSLTSSQTSSVISVSSETSDSSSNSEKPQGPRTFSRNSGVRKLLQAGNSKKSDNSGSVKSEKVETQKTYAIFRSRRGKTDEKKSEKTDPVVRRILTSPKKSPTKAVYNPRQWTSSDAMAGSDDSQESNSQPVTKTAKVKELPPLRRTVTWPEQRGKEKVSTLKVNREHKPLFTVVRNVKQAHECAEHGETQEFEDDIEYIMDGLQDCQSTSVRCLSVMSLASKCSMAPFRMHLRAHGTLTKIFSALHNADKNPSLALCTAAVMYLMSLDRLNMDLERESLRLMLQLLGLGSEGPSDEEGLAEYNRNMEKIKAICQEMKKNGANHVDIAEISTGNLAMETLLSLTSRRAGEWFKEELRLLGGLDHLITIIADSIKDLSTPVTEVTNVIVEQVQRIERCLRVMENVTHQNTDNQEYLISFQDSLLISSLCRVLQKCADIIPLCPLVDEEFDKDSEGHVILHCLLAILRVLLNLTHDHEIGSSLVGKQSGLLECTLNCALQLPQHVPTNQRFDLLVLSLGLLINLCEHCANNCIRLVDLTVCGPHGSEWEADQMGALESLVHLFQLRFKAAKLIEKEEEEMNSLNNGDSKAEEAEQMEVSGEWKESDSGLEWIMKAQEETEKDADEDSVNLDLPELPEIPELPSNQREMNNEEQDQASQQITQEEQENLTKALHKAGRHMEDSIVAAYIALLIGCVINRSSEYVDMVRERLPEGDFEPMIFMLKKFLGFMNLTIASGSAGNKSITRVIEILEAC